MSENAQDLRKETQRRRPPHGPGARMMPGEKAKDFKGTIAKLVRFMGQFKVSLAVAIVFAIFSAAFSIVGPKVLSQATTELFNGIVAKIGGTGGINFDAIAGIIGATLALYLVSAACSFLQGWMMSSVSQRTCYGLRRAIAEKIDRVPVGYFERNSIGDTLSRITNDVDTLGQSLNQGVTQMITSITTLIGVVAMMVSINLVMTGITLVMLPVSLVLIMVVVKLSQKHFRAQQEKLGEINGQVEETFSGHAIVRAFNQEQACEERFEETNDKLYESAWKSQFLSGLMMPVLAVLIVVIALYSLTIPGTLAGVKYYLMPDFSQFSASTVLGACGQMFYSMSLAMGITITYGSYMPKENLLEHSVTQIEIFDTLFAFFAGLMIIPAVIAFNGGDPSQVNSGPSLMFISLPMVFDSMKFGTVIGAVFFLLVLFAALTSSIALMETLASVIMDKFKLKRIPATLIIIAICLVVGMLSCLGYGPWESVTIIGMQFLDFFDFISNSVLMPIVAVLTCVLIGHVVGTRVVADEVKSGAGSFHREKLHRVMIRWIAPILLVAILASELASKIFGVFSI